MASSHLLQHVRAGNVNRRECSALVSGYKTLRSPSRSRANADAPTALTRHKLSTLVNELLHRDDGSRIPFDILINGEFLRTTIDEFLTKNGINAESTLDV